MLIWLDIAISFKRIRREGIFEEAKSLVIEWLANPLRHKSDKYWALMSLAVFAMEVNRRDKAAYYAHQVLSDFPEDEFALKVIAHAEQEPAS